jgi:hypothetical protein
VPIVFEIWEPQPSGTLGACPGRYRDLLTYHDVTEESYISTHSSILSLTSALDGGWSPPLPSRFNSEKETPYPLHRRLGGPGGWSGRVQRISPPRAFEPRTVQPVASCYTACATAAASRLLCLESEENHKYISWVKFSVVSIRAGDTISCCLFLDTNKTRERHVGTMQNFSVLNMVVIKVAGRL